MSLTLYNTDSRMGKMQTTRDSLAISLLDDLSHNVNDDKNDPGDHASFMSMAISAKGIELEKKRYILRLTDPLKRAVGFVYEKMMEVLGKGEFRSLSDNYVRIFDYKLDASQKCDYQAVHPNKGKVYLWRDNFGIVHRIHSVEGEWEPKPHSRRHFSKWASGSRELSDVLARLPVWSENRADETTMCDDIQVFPLRESNIPCMPRPPTTDRCYPNAVYEGELQYTSDRDVNHKPVIVARQVLVVKKARVSVQFYKGARANDLVKVFYMPA